jgi:hypothetical protein
MSFGYGVNDFLSLIERAWKTVQNARKACGAYGYLTDEVTSMHKVLRRLQEEIDRPTSLLNREQSRRQELGAILVSCEKVLRVLDSILEKYNALPEEKRGVTGLWQKIRFGNGEMQDLGELRLQLSNYTSTIALHINLASSRSHGRVEQIMERQGGVLLDMRQTLDVITASKSAKNREGSVLTSYADDNKAFWKDIRRDLIAEGYPSSVIAKHKDIIKEYVMELGSRGAFDVELEHGVGQTFELGLEVESGQRDTAHDVEEQEHVSGSSGRTANQIVSSKTVSSLTIPVSSNGE